MAKKKPINYDTEIKIRISKDKTEEIKNYINSLPTREHLFDSFIPGDVKYTILKILESEE